MDTPHRKPENYEDSDVEFVSPLDCQHLNLQLEQTHADYLTGWYVCVGCGERFKTI
jgi:hypothetical protein